MKSKAENLDVFRGSLKVHCLHVYQTNGKVALNISFDMI